jgi:hypothetical protein
MAIDSMIAALDKTRMAWPGVKEVGVKALTEAWARWDALLHGTSRGPQLGLFARVQPIRHVVDLSRVPRRSAAMRNPTDGDWCPICKGQLPGLRFPHDSEQFFSLVCVADRQCMALRDMAMSLRTRLDERGPCAS